MTMTTRPLLQLSLRPKPSTTPDATLWFFHALHRYDTVTGEHALVEELLPVLQDIVRCHRHGTAFNIHVDADGLLSQGAPGVQLTWMDALVDGWVVTPRRARRDRATRRAAPARCARGR